MKQLRESSLKASALLKGLANDNRLMILCALIDAGEMNVSELEQSLGIRQPTLSQQLARLRADNLVETRRDSKSIYYSVASTEAKQVIQVLHELFCEPGKTAAEGEPKEDGKTTVALAAAASPPA